MERIRGKIYYPVRWYINAKAEPIGAMDNVFHWHLYGALRIEVNRRINRIFDEIDRRVRSS